MTEPVRYRVRLSNPHAHLLDVEMCFVAPADGVAAITMPSWTPGSYLLREFGRFVQDLTAWSEGSQVAVTKTAKATWQAAVTPDRPVVFHYSVYAHTRSPRNPHVDGTHAFLIGTGVFAYAHGLLTCPVTVRVDQPAGWSVAASLAKDDQDAYTADNYEHLADSLFELGSDLDRFDFEHAGVKHEVVFWGRGNYDRQALLGDLPRIVAENAALFGGGLPYDRYLFVVHLTDGPQGGLEHRECCALQWPRHRFVDRQYAEFLRLVAHEHFHVWNVKRIRPRALGPFDYTRENHTRALWAIEGITSYYDQRHLAQAGLITAERYLGWVAEQIERLEAVPGRQRQSLEEASYDTWHVLYKPTEQAPNNSVSYYLLGSLVALVLDLEIRRATSGRRSLDSVMRTLWAGYLQTPQHGVADDEFKRLVVAVGGPPLADLVTGYVEERREIDWPQHLELVGVSLERDAASPSPDLGLLKRDDGDRIIISSVLEHGPNAGLNVYPGDEVIAVDRYRITPHNFHEVLQLLPLQGPVELALARAGELIITEGRVAPKPGPPRLVRAPNASEEQVRRFDEWLGPRERAESARASDD